jgi:hypothetical protein
MRQIQQVQEERVIKVSEKDLVYPINQSIMDDPAIATDSYTKNIKP